MALLPRPEPARFECLVLSSAVSSRGAAAALGKARVVVKAEESRPHDPAEPSPASRATLGCGLLGLCLIMVAVGWSVMMTLAPIAVAGPPAEPAITATPAATARVAPTPTVVPTPDPS